MELMRRRKHSIDKMKIQELEMQRHVGIQRIEVAFDQDLHGASNSSRKLGPTKNRGEA